MAVISLSSGTEFEVHIAPGVIANTSAARATFVHKGSQIHEEPSIT
ncbi:hypothetical protein QG37_07702 [Candidozyma auris]|nr:hypothetical protein QG37_07702 [[Candida] auris]